MVSPFGYTGASRPGLFNQQQQPYNFSGWDDRLSKIEKGIAGLTEQFGNFQAPGDVAPEYTGNAAPEPLEQTTNTPEPLGGIESLVAEPAPAKPMPLEPTSMADWMKGYEFDLAPMMPQFQQDPNQAGGFNTQFGQHHEDWRNNPENMAWQQRKKERGDLSQGTWDAITGGQRMDSNAQHTVIPYIRGGGGGYEDYLSQNEKMKEARPQIEALRNNWQGAQSQDMIDQMNAIYQSVGLGQTSSGLEGQRSTVQGGPIGMGLGGGQQQQLSRMAAPDPTKMMGGENWKPIGEEEYGRQQDLWGSHMDYGAFSQAAFNQLGTAGNDISRYKQGSNPMFGHAYEAWQKFNESQPGGPYTTPTPARDPFGQLDFAGVRGVNTNSQNTLSQVGLGSLRGPTQQKIQQGLGSLGAGI